MATTWASSVDLLVDLTEVDGRRSALERALGTRYAMDASSPATAFPRPGRWPPTWAWPGAP